MITAMTLIQTEREAVNTVAEQLAAIPGITEVYSVSGEHDLIAMIRVSNNEQMAEVVTERLRMVKGITNTETLIAFRVYSRHDLDSMFAIGMVD